MEMTMTTVDLTFSDVLNSVISKMRRALAAKSERAVMRVYGQGTVEAALKAIADAEHEGELRPATAERLRRELVATGPRGGAYKRTIEELLSQARAAGSMSDAVGVIVGAGGVLAHADIQRLAVDVVRELEPKPERPKVAAPTAPTIATVPSVASVSSAAYAPKVATPPKPAPAASPRIAAASGAPGAAIPPVSSVQPSRSRCVWNWVPGRSRKTQVALVASVAIGMTIVTLNVLDSAHRSWLAGQDFGYRVGDLVMSNRSVWGPGSIFAEAGRVREVIKVIGYGPCTAAGGDADDPAGAPPGRIGSWVITTGNGNPPICQRVGDVQPIKRAVRSVATTAKDIVYQGGTLSRGQSYYVADLACPPSRVYPSIGLEAAEVDVCVQLRDLVPVPWQDDWTIWTSIKDWWR
jgi:hypothetical protein